jgi:hypothetical protein
MICMTHHLDESKVGIAAIGVCGSSCHATMSTFPAQWWEFAYSHTQLGMLQYWQEKVVETVWNLSILCRYQQSLDNLINCAHRSSNMIQKRKAKRISDC